MTATHTAHTPFDADAVPGALGSTLRLARAWNWTVGNPAPHVVTLTAPNGANRVMLVADPVTGGILRTWVANHRLPRPLFPVHAMGAVTRPDAPVSLSKVYVPRSTYRDR